MTSTRVEHLSEEILRVEGHLEAAGMVVPLQFTAALRSVAAGFEVEATTTVDQRKLGMSTGKLGMIRTPATLHVKALLTAAGERQVRRPVRGGG